MSWRVYDIVSSMGQRKRPCAHLEYNLNHDDFLIRIEPWATEDDVPMLFIPFLEERVVPSHWARVWVETRTVPAGRQNLGEILRAHHLGEYDLIALMERTQGRSSDDEFMIIPHEEENEMPDEKANLSEVTDPDFGWSEPFPEDEEDAEDGAEANQSDETALDAEPEEPPSVFTYKGPSYIRYAMVTLGGELKTARLDAGLTQQDLSERTGIQQSLISRIERGKANPTYETMTNYAKGCGKRLRVILE